MVSSLPVKAIDLIPHRRGMMLIDQLTRYSEDDATAMLRVHPGNLFLNKKQQLDAVVLVELLAQTAAAHSGYKALNGAGEPKFGFLVGIKDFKIYSTAGVDEQLTLSIHRDFQMDNVSFLAGEVLRGKESLAEGVLKLWEMPAAEAGMPKMLASQDNHQPFRQFNKQQIEVIETSSLNRQIIQHCTDFKFAQEPGIVEAEFCYQKNFIGFEGHFPDNPIVPGVLMLKTGLLLSELAKGHKFSLQNIQTAKFAKTILPSETIHYSLSIKENKIKVQVKKDEALCAKFSFELK